MKQLETLNDTELLTAIIGPSAHPLIKRFQNLRLLSKSTVKELEEIPGVGPVKAHKIQACFEIYRRINQIPLSYGEKLTNSETVFHHFQNLLNSPVFPKNSFLIRNKNIRNWPAIWQIFGSSMTLRPIDTGKNKSLPLNAGNYSVAIDRLTAKITAYSGR